MEVVRTRSSLLVTVQLLSMPNRVDGRMKDGIVTRGSLSLFPLVSSFHCQHKKHGSKCLSGAAAVDSSTTQRVGVAYVTDLLPLARAC